MLVTISDTIYQADGTLANGAVFVEWQTFTSAQGAVVVQNGKEFQINNGVLSLQLQDNSGASPSGTSYTATWALFGQSNAAEYWIVPASGTPVNLAQIRTVTLSNPSLAIAASQITGILALVHGGSGADLSATGGAHQVLRQSTLGGAVTVSQLAVADITGGNDAASLTVGQVALSQGGTHANLSATGGVHQVLQQSSTGANVTVAQLAVADITGGNDASSLTTGTLPSARLALVGTAGTYGTATQVPVLTTDAQGRISAVTNTSISFPGANPAVVAKSANYTIVIADGTNTVFVVDCTGGPVTITLYTAVGHAGARLGVKKIDSSLNGLTITTAGGNIDGSPSIIVGVPGTSYDFLSDNANWWIT